MRVAVTYDNGEIFQHFGRTGYFKFYDIEEGKITDTKIAGTNGQGHGALAWLLQGVGTDVLICGGIGGGAQAALSQAGITLYGGVTGSADEAVNRLIAGTLEYDPDIACNHHHEHGEDGCCGRSHDHDEGCGCRD